MIRIQNLELSYEAPTDARWFRRKSSTPQSTMALQDVNLQVEKGELVALLGPSGCGKTSLLQCISGLQKPQKGTITIADQTVVSDKIFVPASKRETGTVFQDYALFPHMTVAANVGYGVQRNLRQSRITEMLELVGLTSQATKKPHQLSGGQRQRVALARALAPNPKVILLDEPWAAVDAARRGKLRAELITILREAGTTIVLVTHDRDEALSVADRVAVMRAGEIRQYDAPEVVYSQPDDSWIGKFVGPGNLVPAVVVGNKAQTALGEFDCRTNSWCRLITPASDAPKNAGRVLIRPEQVLIAPVSTNSDRSVQATVTQRNFHGHDVSYMLQLRDGTEIISQQPSNLNIQLGDTVEVSIVDDILSAYATDLFHPTTTQKINMKLPKFTVATVAAVAGSSLAFTACGSDDQATTTAGTNAASNELTVYSGRDAEYVKGLFESFSKETGIKINARYGDSAEMAATIAEEGSKSPADVFISQDAGSLGAVKDESLLADVPGSVAASVDQRFRDSDNKWVGLTGRARVIAYSTRKVKSANVPSSVLDLTNSKWRGKVGIAPGNASFQAFVSGMRLAIGEAKTKEWLVALKKNKPKTYEKNGLIVEALDRGEINVGLVNHYYVFEKKQDNPDLRVKNKFTKAGDPGSMVNVSGIAALESSDSKEAAGKLVDYLLGKSAQTFFSTKVGEYPLASGVKHQSTLPSLDKVVGPEINLNDLGKELPATLELLNEVGLT